MKKQKAIPEGYMTVGELAKKMGVTVRTLQHYDAEGFFSPSAKSEGGRRLYTNKDIVKLHKILSLKHFGFSLKDIKNKVIPLETPSDVAKILTEQAEDMKREIEKLSRAYEELELLKVEVLQMQSVDFKKYADIILNLQMKNDYYWLIKHFDERLLNHVCNRYDMESAKVFINKFNRINNKLCKFQQDNIPTDSKEAQKLAKDFWNMVMEFTDGDMSLLPKLINIVTESESNTKWGQNQAQINTYIDQALTSYFTTIGHNPIKEITNE